MFRFSNFIYNFAPKIKDCINILEMKKVVILSFAALAIVGCKHDLDDVLVSDKDLGVENAKAVLGENLDFTSDWGMLKSSSVTITADAEGIDIAKVQILTANPFTTEKAFVLNEVAAKKGEKVTLNYDAPNFLDSVYAACLDAQGHYRVKDFKIGQETVSFNNQAVAQTARRAAVATPTVLTGKDSWNATRLAAYKADNKVSTQWKDSKWNDKLYDISATIEDVADFTAVERKDFTGYMEASVPEKSDNRKRIMLSDIYVNSANYMSATGTQQSITVTPLSVGGNYWPDYKLYYYYFDPAQTAGMSKEERIEFLESLPKYKLMDQRDANAKVFTGWPQMKRCKTFTLAYFGEGEPTEGMQGTYEFPKGTYIGFMLQHLENQNYGTHIYNGEFYGDSLLNNEVNKFGDAAKAKMGTDATRAAIFGANGSNYIGFEDKNDNDFNDVIFQVAGGVEIVDPHLELDKNVYTYSFEDRVQGDYDLNDVVVKAQRVDKTHVKFSLEACGAEDELFLKGDIFKNAEKLLTTKEIHEIFGGNAGSNQFINTKESWTHIAPVQEIFEVSENFSFGNPNFEFYIYNNTTKRNVKLARAGQDPHGILIPWDFQYPQEQIVVKNAYKKFNNWGSKRVDETDWYKYPEAGKIYTKSVFERVDEK